MEKESYIPFDLATYIRLDLLAHCSELRIRFLSLTALQSRKHGYSVGARDHSISHSEATASAILVL